MSSFLTSLGGGAGGSSPPATSSTQGIIKLTNHLGGTANNPTVIKINGASVPISGSLVTGNVLQVSGANALSYGPINLGGGSNYVTGVLPPSNLTSATPSNEGIIQLAGDLSGTSSAPEVTDLTITGENDGSLLYFNGTNWVQLSAGTNNQYLKINGVGLPEWSTTSYSGTATVNFGTGAGTNIASVTVTGQTGISASSLINVKLSSTGTADNNSFEHNILSFKCAVFVDNIVNGVGFDITIMSDLRLNGTFNVQWDWK